MTKGLEAEPGAGHADRFVGAAADIVRRQHVEPAEHSGAGYEGKIMHEGMRKDELDVGEAGWPVPAGNTFVPGLSLNLSDDLSATSERECLMNILLVNLAFKTFSRNINDSHHLHRGRQHHFHSC